MRKKNKIKKIKENKKTSKFLFFLKNIYSDIFNI
tara:strand:- start:478 stop:579 length:102 start_codon:yes stop_codon:yes gene_type:complete